MTKLSDRIFFSTAIILLSYGWCEYLTDNRKLSLLVAALVYALTATVYTFVRNRRQNLKVVTPNEMCLYLALMGTDKSTRLIYGTVPDSARISVKPPYFLCEERGIRYLVAVLYKFINLTREDVAAAYREASANGVTHIKILARARDRSVINLGGLLPVSLEYHDKYAVHRYLKKHNALPKKLEAGKKKRSFELRALFDSVFEGSRAKYYLLLSVFLAGFAFLTPLRTYYLAFAFLPLAMGGICLLKAH